MQVGGGEGASNALFIDTYYFWLIALGAIAVLRLLTSARARQYAWAGLNLLFLGFVLGKQIVWLVAGGVVLYFLYRAYRRSALRLILTLIISAGRIRALPCLQISLLHTYRLAAHGSSTARRNWFFLCLPSRDRPCAFVAGRPLRSATRDGDDQLLGSISHARGRPDPSLRRLRSTTWRAGNAHHPARRSTLRNGSQVASSKNSCSHTRFKRFF